jgi:hypothetical protein
VRVGPVRLGLCYVMIYYVMSGSDYAMLGSVMLGLY